MSTAGQDRKGFIFLLHHGYFFFSTAMESATAPCMGGCRNSRSSALRRRRWDTRHDVKLAPRLRRRLQVARPAAAPPVLKNLPHHVPQEEIPAHSWAARASVPAAGALQLLLTHLGGRQGSASRALQANKQAETCATCGASSSANWSAGGRAAPPPPPGCCASASCRRPASDSSCPCAPAAATTPPCSAPSSGAASARAELLSG